MTESKSCDGEQTYGLVDEVRLMKCKQLRFKDFTLIKLIVVNVGISAD